MERPDLEEAMAHMTRSIDELSGEVARQGAELDRLTRRVALLMERAALAEAGDGGVVLGDERPPHY